MQTASCNIGLLHCSSKKSVDSDNSDDKKKSSKKSNSESDKNINSVTGSNKRISGFADSKAK